MRKLTYEEANFAARLLTLLDKSPMPIPLLAVLAVSLGLTQYGMCVALATLQTRGLLACEDEDGNRVEDPGLGVVVVLTEEGRKTLDKHRSF